MLLKLITAFTLILLMMLGWLVVQQTARLFARRHPEFGAYRDGGGCGSGSCSCSGRESCQRGEGH